MLLSSFGAILTFAESLESGDAAFYRSVCESPGGGEQQSLFERFAAEGQKNVKNIQRTRRENVTEMILEPIQDFTREPFVVDPGDPSAMDPSQTLEAARLLETRAAAFYQAASEKIRALPEVSRALKRLGKKRKERLAALP